ASLAAEARAAGAQVILHLPMEPKGYPEENPGPGALLSAMDETSLRAMAARDLDWVGPVRGLNNHMGSRLTEDRASMDRLMRELKARGMFFLDSRTSPASVAADAARAAGVPVLERSVFLDDARDEAAIRGQLERAIALAEKRGRRGVVAIGHPYKETYAVLAEFAPRLREGPVRPVLLDELAARADEGAS
ncbi:MAG: divergent polysaccharide deacetylase family protein, partial [Candidatus Methylomirabilis sp.]|nr:divergent polysaccharide deacetylase family protein [Deltaproteobacteria bacterium]